jgi:transcriptional regulator with XRE-family HTH domain
MAMAKKPASTIAIKLRTWRRQRGWTRKEAAAFLEISPKTLESYELGYRTPPALDMLERLWSPRPGREEKQR